MFSRRDAANKKPAPQKVSEPGINFWVHQSVTDRIWDNFCNCVHCHRNPGQNKFKSNVSLTELTEVILILLLRWKVFLKFCTYYVRQIWPFKRCLRMYKFAWFFFARNMLKVGVICVNLLCTFVVQILCANFLGRYVLRGVICANSAAAVSQLPEMQPLKNLQARASLFSSLHLSPTAFALLISNTKLDNTNNAIWDGSSQSLQLTWV